MRNANCEIIAIANQKGGVGKTTTAVNIATAMAATGKRTLFIDLDPQGNGSTGLGIGKEKRKVTTYDLLVNDVSLRDIEQKTTIPRLSALPSTIDLSAIDVELSDVADREYRLKDQINECDNYYDYIFIDCPPSLGLLTVNALTAASSVIIPLQCEFFSLEGLSHLLNTISLIQNNLNPDLGINGILLTMYDKRNRLTIDVEKDVRDFMKDKVFETVIPRNVRLSEAPSHGKPAIVYDMHCPGSKAYIYLAKEILSRAAAAEAKISETKLQEA